MWSEVKKTNGKRSSPPNIDGVSDPQDIADLFRNKYENLYNCNPPDKYNMVKIGEYIEKSILSSDRDDYTANEGDVVKAVARLKKGKSDGDKDVFSDHIINGPPVLFKLIALLITTSRIHGHMPEDMLLASIASIPKDTCGNMCAGDNYRGIALSSALSKISDIIILSKYKDVLASGDMQYAFKNSHGTAMCTLTVKEVVRYYWRKGSRVYTSFVDASKAFDRVKHDMLFLLLIERGLPPVILNRSFKDENCMERQCLRLLPYRERNQAGQRHRFHDICSPDKCSPDKCSQDKCSPDKCSHAYMENDICSQWLYIWRTTFTCDIFSFDIGPN